MIYILLFYWLFSFFVFFFFFFFSSRRRHTRCSRDWSSDVCSSDLGGQVALPAFLDDELQRPGFRPAGRGCNDGLDEVVALSGDGLHGLDRVEIGRASCRERV